MTSTATSEPEEKPRTRGGLATLPLLMYGVLSILGGVFLYLVGTVLSVGRFIVPFRAPLEAAIRACVWYSCAPILLGLVLAAIDLFVLLPGKRRASMISGDLGIPESARITVVLTAYNDEESIGAAVADFRAQPQVNRVI